MKTLIIMRRIVGIITVVLLAVVLVSTFLGEDFKLVWHLDSKAAIFIPVFTLFYAILLTIYIFITKSRVGGKVLACFGCVMVFLVCLVFNFFVEEHYNRKVWEGNGYVVYEEYKGELPYEMYRGEIDGFETKFVLYKRNGILDERLLLLKYWGVVERHSCWAFDTDDKNTKLSFTIFENLDLIRMESCYKEIENDGTSDISFDTSYCRFSDGLLYFGRERDSLMRLIQKTNH